MSNEPLCFVQLPAGDVRTLATAAEKYFESKRDDQFALVDQIEKVLSQAQTLIGIALYLSETYGPEKTMSLTDYSMQILLHEKYDK